MFILSLGFILKNILVMYTKSSVEQVKRFWLEIFGAILKKNEGPDFDSEDEIEGP